MPNYGILGVPDSKLEAWSQKEENILNKKVLPPTSICAFIPVFKVYIIILDPRERQDVVPSPWFLFDSNVFHSAKQIKWVKLLSFAFGSET